MRGTLSAVLLFAGSAAASLPPSPKQAPDWSAIVAAVNLDPESSWEATLPSARDVHRAVDLVGGYKPFRELYPDAATHPLPRVKEAHEFQFAVEDLPTNYDTRAAYPSCPSIRSVRDQCGCGSCFAFGSVEAFEDRICIHLKKNITLSPEDIISCHEDENMSCQGGTKKLLHERPWHRERDPAREVVIENERDEDDTCPRDVYMIYDVTPGPRSFADPLRPLLTPLFFSYY